MRRKIAVRLLLLSFVLLAITHHASAQIGVGISVSFGPPPIPVYEQPICPSPGWLWQPGYWAYDDDDGYYWVPGTWVEPPEVGVLWTPGYWGWNNGAYLWYDGYWGPMVGFYGGINYGFGYFGEGFVGGEWRENRFYYNTAVMRVDTVRITNVYVNRTVVVNNNVHVAYNGGPGGIPARPSPREEAYAHERHIPPVPAQVQHVQEARRNPELRAATNQGRPPIAATARPTDFRAGAMPARAAGGEYKAPPPNANRGNGGRPGNEARPNGGGNYNHAGDLQQHHYTPPNTGNPGLDRRYQQQQDRLAAQQDREHQRLQQQQEREHQQAQQRNYDQGRQQQMEQRHAQQTQQMEQRHTQQQQRMEQRQAPPQRR